MTGIIRVILLCFALISAPVVSGEIPEPKRTQVERITPTFIYMMNSVMAQSIIEANLYFAQNFIFKRIQKEPEKVRVELKPVKKVVLTEEGKASYYYYENDDKLASGERYSTRVLAAAHKTLPFGTIVRVTRLDTLQSVVVKINDRGPYIRGRIIDLNIAAARKIGIAGRKGIAPCKLEILKKG